MSDASLRIGIDSAPSRTGATEVKRSLEDIRRKAGETTQSVHRVSGSFDRMRGAIFAVKGAIAALGIGLFVRDAIQAGLALDRINAALRVASGSALGAAREFAFVRNVSNELGLSLQSAATQYSKLAAAAKGTAIEGQAARDIFVGIAKASTALSLTADQVGGALTAVEQIISKGTVSAEELRGQLGERLPGAFQIAARSIGVTTQELGKMLEQGQLTADKLLPALARELEKTFGEEARRNADMLTSRINRLNNAWFEFETQLGDSVLTSVLTEALTLMTGLLNQVNQIFVDDDNLSPGQAMRTIIDLQQRLEASQATGFDRLGHTTFELQTRLERLRGLYPEIAKAAGEALASAGSSTESVTKEQTKFRKELDALLHTIDPFAGALADFRADQDLLNKGFAEGVLTGGELNDALDRLHESYREALDPIGSLNAEMERERELVAMTADEREIHNGLLDIENRLKKAGINDARQVAQGYRQELVALQQLEAARRHAEDSYQEIARSAEQAFDRIGEAITQGLVTGEFAMEDLANVWSAVVSEMIQTAARLAVINPILNDVFGGARPTLDAAMQGAQQQGGGIPNIPGGGGLFGNFSGTIDSFGASLGFSPGVASAMPAAPLMGANGMLAGGGATSIVPGQVAAGSTFGTTTLSGFLGGAGAGFGAGMFLNSLVGGNSTGGMIGSGGGALAGAAIGSAIPGVGTLLGGLIGGAGGGLLGGLFGPDPTVGPNSTARGTLHGGLVGLTDAGADNEGDVQKSIALLTSLSQALDQVNQATLRDIGAQEARFTVMEQTGEITVEAAGQTGVFKDEAQAVTFALQALVGNMAGLDKEMERVVRESASLEQALADLESIKAIDSLRMNFTAATDMERQVGELTARYRELTNAAERLNLSEGRRLRILEGQAREMAFLVETFESDIARQMLALTNSAAASLADIQDDFVLTLRNAAAVGADLVQVEELYGAKRLAAVQRFSDAQLRALEGGSQLDKSVAAYERARREIQMALDGMEAPFRAFVSAAQAFRDNLQGVLDGFRLDQSISPLSAQERLMTAQGAFGRDLLAAQGGDASALANIASSAQAFLQESASFNASTGAHGRTFEHVTSALEQLGVSLEPEIDVQQKQLDELTKIRDLLAQPQIDTGALTAALAAVGLDPKMAGGLVKQVEKTQQSLKNETGNAARDALQEAYSQALLAGRAGDAGAAASWYPLAIRGIEKGWIDRSGARKDAENLRERGFDIPEFARGGFHSGGLRLVGESGPELEFTGPSRIFSAGETASMLRGDSDAAREVRGMREDNRRLTGAVIELLEVIAEREGEAGDTAREQLSEIRNLRRDRTEAA